LPEDLDDFVIVSSMLLVSSQATWIDECLRAEPMQEKVSFVNFAQLVPDLTQLRHEALISLNKQEFLQQPFFNWMQLLIKITSRASLLNTDSLGWQQVINELVSLFGDVYRATLYDICQDPHGSTSLVLGQVNNKLN
jgi:hypothetical protein